MGKSRGFFSENSFLSILEETPFRLLTADPLSKLDTGANLDFDPLLPY
jgi:hypothetical protein